MLRESAPDDSHLSLRFAYYMKNLKRRYIVEASDKQAPEDQQVLPYHLVDAGETLINAGESFDGTWWEKNVAAFPFLLEPETDSQIHISGGVSSSSGWNWFDGMPIAG